MLRTAKTCLTGVNPFTLMAIFRLNIFLNLWPKISSTIIEV